MSLDLGYDEETGDIFNLFGHANRYDEGLGKIRTGKSYILVAQDGSGDCDNLKEAYRDINKNGGKIFIKEGTYELKSPILIGKKNITIEGSGYSTIVTGNNINPLLSISGSNVKISNILFKNLSSNITTGTRLIDISGSNLCKIDKCFFEGFDRVIWLRGGSSECMISNNQINTTTLGAGYGIYLSNSSRNTIENNFIDNSYPEQAIYLDTSSDYNLISKNNFTGQNTMLQGIWIASGSNNIIAENQIAHFAEYGIYIAAGNNNNVVTSNFLTANFSPQLQDLGTNTQIAHNIIV